MGTNHRNEIIMPYLNRILYSIIIISVSFFFFKIVERKWYRNKPKIEILVFKRHISENRHSVRFLELELNVKSLLA